MPIGVYVRTKKRVYETRPLELRFWPKVQKSDGCWLWIAGGDGKTGYGRIREGRAGRPTLLAHRVAWELTFGPIPDGLFVCHHCDTPRCVRPDHLFLGTSDDNNKNAAAKGRFDKGDRWFAHRPDRQRLPRPYTVANGRPRRTKPDPVTAVVRWAVVKRDGMCVLAKLEPGHVCRDVWGNEHRSDNLRALTLEHVKDELRMGVRAPSLGSNLVALCGMANVSVPSKQQRELMREYLRTVGNPHEAHVDPCSPTCRVAVA